MREKSFLNAFKDPESKYRPEVRWWLAEGLNTDATLKRNIELIDRYGFGAAELIAMPEPHADDKIYGWGSGEWNSDIRLIAGETSKRGMGFSLTSGAHWSCANLPDTFDGFNADSKAAAQELDYAYTVLEPGGVFSGELLKPEHVKVVDDDHHGTDASYKLQHFIGAVAAKLLRDRYDCGKPYGYDNCIAMGELEFNSLNDISSSVRDSKITFTAPSDGKYALFFFWMHGTAQTASPSVSTNYCINYLDRYGSEALIRYWDTEFLDKEFLRTIAENGRAEMYMDSLELLSFGNGGLLWGFGLASEFRKRRGYPVIKYLPLLLQNRARVTSSRPNIRQWTVPGYAEQAQKIVNDYNATISELYCENLLCPLQKWLHKHNMGLRAEPSYGVNFEISTPAKYLDDVEAETYAQACDPDLYRGLSGSANVYGRIFSSETGAVPGKNYFYDMGAWTNVCFVQFACGVTRTVLHGYSAIEGAVADTRWPGHEGMFPRYSERFGERQPASLHYPLWTKMLCRIQKAMRQGHPVRDLSILRTDCAFPNYGQPEGENTFENNAFMQGRLSLWSSPGLQNEGYTYDYFSPALLCDGNAGLKECGYKAFIVYQEMLDKKSAETILKMAANGTVFIFADNNDELRVYRMPKKHHGIAASKSAEFCVSDAEIQGIVRRILSLPNTFRVSSPSEVPALLRRIGIVPRVGFGTADNGLLCATVYDAQNNLEYVFADRFKFALEKGPVSNTLVFEHPGKTYRIDYHTGDVLPLTSENSLNICLQPGEGLLLVRDLSDFLKVPSAVTEYSLPVELNFRSLCIEDWDEGERVINTEEKSGHTTYEAFFTTKKSLFTFENPPLVPWRELDASLENCSGVGKYRCTFENGGMTNAFVKAQVCGCSAKVTLNGTVLGLLDHATGKIDISGALREGINNLEIETASTLTNRLIGKGYPGWSRKPEARDYGLVGKVLLVPYSQRQER